MVRFAANMACLVDHDVTTAFS